MDDDELVTVDVFWFPDQAKLARAMLEAEDIPVYLENEHTLSANWMWTNLLGGLRLKVPAQFLERAKQVLASQVSDETLDAQAEAAETEPPEQKDE